MLDSQATRHARGRCVIKNDDVDKLEESTGTFRHTLVRPIMCFINTVTFCKDSMITRRPPAY